MEKGNLGWALKSVAMNLTLEQKEPIRRQHVNKGQKKQSWQRTAFRFGSPPCTSEEEKGEENKWMSHRLEGESELSKDSDQKTREEG